MASSSSSSERRTQILRPANSNFVPNYTEEKLRPFLLEDEVPRIIRRPASGNNNHEALRWKAIHILDSLDHNAFEEFITNLDSSRVNKHLYNFCRTNYANALSMKLSYLLLQSHNPQVKSKCANLLHLFLENSSYWSSTSHVARGQLKIVILEILKQDNPKDICKKVWMTASQICRRGILERRGVWQDMLSFFYESLHSDVSYVQDCAVMFFVALPGCLREELSQNIENLRLKLLNKFNSSNGKRKVVALGALVNLVHHMSSDYYSQFDDLLMPMINGVMDFVDNNVEEDNVQRSIKKLAELVGPHARFFDSHLNQLFDALVTIGENDRLGDETRYLAIEMMSAFDDISIKNVGYEILGRLSFVLIWMISLIPDGSMDYILGIDFMERISMVRGDELWMPLLLEKIQKDIASSEWRRRFAAVTFIRVTAKGCAKDMKNNLALVMNAVLKSMLDSSFSVRHAAIVTVKVMSLELPPHTLDQHADLLITSLYLALADGRSPLKQAAAASAMGPLCDSCSSCILEPRLHTIVSKLLQLIQSPSVDLQAESLKALASVARSSKDLFCEYYELVITTLKKVLVDATSVSVQDNAVELQLDDAVECIWTVAMTVGKNIFKRDAAEVVVLMLSVRWYLAEDDRGSKVTFIRAWKQLLRCLGSHFYPYVNDIMPTLLRSARLGSSGNEKSAPERYILWEKLKACKLLLRLTKQFKGKFFPWIDQVSDILVPLVTFHEKDIRKLAFSAMPKLLLSAKLSIEKKQAHGLTNSYLHKLVLRIVPSLLDALDKETDGEICVKILKSLNKCIKFAGPFLSEKKIQRMANAIEQVLIAISRKHFSQEENVTQLEKEIIKKVVIYFRILINIYEESSWTFVDKFLELIKAMMGNDATEKDKQVALLTFNEISLKCEEAAHRFYETPIIWQQMKPNNG